MSTQVLSVPVNLTWRRFAYAADMIDTDFGDAALPPKWRSSMAVYYYLVPKEQTAEAYPDSRIVYLRLTSSITGWNLDEEIQELQGEISIDDLPDDLQKSVFEAFQAGALAEYSPCTSAIAQIGVYPHFTDDVGPDDYPFIFDFEPKKRELYETASASEEYLSASSENLRVQKGTTTLDSTEKSSIKKAGGKFGVSVGPVSVGGSASGEWGQRERSDVETVDLRSTDTSRQQREATSFTTSFSQMYQLFNGYHLGTNRAVFYVQARPHTVTEGASGQDDFRQVEFNLVSGERKLEGVQDVFLVVRVPESLKGLCIQANLDTGHTVNVWEFGQVGGKFEGRRLLVTRRTIQNCALFDDDGDLALSGVPPERPTFPIGPHVIYEDLLAAPPFDVMEGSTSPSPGGASGPGRGTGVGPVAGTAAGVSLAPSALPAFAALDGTYRTRAAIANYMNLVQQQVQRKMLRGFSTTRYEPRPLEETETFALLVRSVLAGTVLDADSLSRMRLAGQDEARIIREMGARTVGDLYRTEAERRLSEADRARLDALRTALVDSVAKTLSGARSARAAKAARKRRG